MVSLMLRAPALPPGLTGRYRPLQEHLDVFQSNGFEFREDEEGRLLLTAVPFSKQTVFGAEDVLELVHLLGGGAGPAAPLAVGQQAAPDRAVTQAVLRPSRVRAMIASRACRSSIMIGKHLDRPTMRRILDNLSRLKAPWNCPHGRPTMRHLFLVPSDKDYGILPV